jgi:Ankyrin repeats (3 copies)
MRSLKQIVVKKILPTVKRKQKDEDEELPVDKESAPLELAADAVADPTSSDGDPSDSGEIADENLEEALANLDIDEDFDVYDSLPESSIPTENATNALCVDPSNILPVENLCGETNPFDSCTSGLVNGSDSGCFDCGIGSILDDSTRGDESANGLSADAVTIVSPAVARPLVPAFSSQQDDAVDDEDDDENKDQMIMIDPYELEDIETWKIRLFTRDEVYSKRYRPSAMEKQEIEALEVLMGLRPPKNRSKKTLFGRLTEWTADLSLSSKEIARREEWKQLVHLDPAKLASANATSTMAPSILLKRGLVTLLLDVPVEYELLLFTHGFALAKVVDVAPPVNEDSSANPTANKIMASNSVSAVPRKFERVWFLSDILFVASSSADSSAADENKPTSNLHNFTGFTISLQRSATSGHAGVGTSKVYRFGCTSKLQRRAWINAFRQVIEQHYTHSHDPRTHELGWIYRLVYTPGFTLAVSNNIPIESNGDSENSTNDIATADGEIQTEPIGTCEKDGSEKEDSSSDTGSRDFASQSVLVASHRCDALSFLRQHPKVLKVCDSYHGYTPLHYAVRGQNFEAVQFLLQAGADPNLGDRAENHSCMFYARMDEVSPAILDALVQHGGTPCKKADAALRGELFGRVQVTEQARAARHEAELEQKQRDAAEKAAKEQANNIRLMQLRGEQINELDDKARELNENAAEYGDLARQLKEKLKKQAGWSLF